MLAVAGAGQDADALHQAGRAHGAISPRTLVTSGESANLLPPPSDRRPGFVASAQDWQELCAVAPEILYGDSPNAASDIWSLGATLHALLIGDAVYPRLEDEHPITAVQRIMFTRPTLDSKLPPALVPIVARCIERDPADRWRTAGELSDHLIATAGTL